MPHLVSLRYFLILPSHRRLGLPSSFILQILVPKSCMQLSSPVRATCPAHHLHDLLTRMSVLMHCALLNVKSCCYHRHPGSCTNCHFIATCEEKGKLAPVRAVMACRQGGGGRCTDLLILNLSTMWM